MPQILTCLSSQTTNGAVLSLAWNECITAFAVKYYDCDLVIMFITANAINQVIRHGLRGSSRRVLTVTALVSGKWQIMTPYRTERNPSTDR